MAVHRAKQNFLNMIKLPYQSKNRDEKVSQEQNLLRKLQLQDLRQPIRQAICNHSLQQV